MILMPLHFKLMRRVVAVEWEGAEKDLSPALALAMVRHVSFRADWPALEAALADPVAVSRFARLVLRGPCPSLQAAPPAADEVGAARPEAEAA